MAIAIFPRLARGQNQALPLRKGHWSTRGLVVVCPMVGGVVSTNPTTRVADVGASGGGQGAAQGWDFPAVLSRKVLIPSTNPAIQPTDRATVLIVLTKTDTTNRGGSAFGCDAGGNTLHANIPWSDGVVYFDFGSVANELGASGLTVSGTNAWAFVAGRNGMAIYRNGLRVASSGTAVTRSASSSNFGLNFGGGVNGDLQRTHFFALLDAEWNPSQVMEWAANPMLMFASTPARVQGTAAAASRLSPFLVGCST